MEITHIRVYFFNMFKKEKEDERGSITNLIQFVLQVVQFWRKYYLSVWLTP